MRHDPRELTIYFKGARGIHVRKQYMNMIFESIDSDGKVKHEKMFKDIEILFGSSDQYAKDHTS